MTAEMQNQQLTGIDPRDPLAFLATLGCLAAVTEQSDRRGLPRPSLAFATGPMRVPELYSAAQTPDALLEFLVADLEDIAGRSDDAERDPFLSFSYEDDKGKVAHDLKPPPPEFRRFAIGQIDRATHDRRRTVDWASAVLTDVAVDGSGSGKPFALHFTAGQQRFLNIALELVDGSGKGRASRAVDRDDLRNTLFQDWADDRALKVFSWSPKQDRAWALRALDPSGDKKMGTPGADWLAFRGIGLLSSAPVHDRIQTGGMQGGWKRGTFTYPVWCTSMDEDAVRSLLRHPAMRPGELSAGVCRTFPRGVERLTCGITRSDQGGYGAFRPPSIDPAQ